MTSLLQALDSIIRKGYANTTEIDVVVANELTLLQRLNAFVGTSLNEFPQWRQFGILRCYYLILFST